MVNCRLCNGTCEESSDSFLQRVYRLECPRCGEYEITDVAKNARLDELVKKHLYLPSALVRNSWEHGKRLRIDAKILEDRLEFEARVLSQCPRSTQEKMNVILHYTADRSEHPGSAVGIRPDTEYAFGYCRDGLEMRFFLDSLHERHLLYYSHGRDDHRFFKLTADGWAKVEELERPNIESKQAFVAMWFDK
jgi:hypothetical protein